MTEESRRRAGFSARDSVPVALADGQQWYFPKPWLEIRPVFHDGKVSSTKCVLTYGDELESLINTVGTCMDDHDLISAVASLASYMLLTNYELSDDDLNLLFRFRQGEPQSEDWVKLVMDVATGHSGPKASSGGGD